MSMLARGLIGTFVLTALGCASTQSGPPTADVTGTWVGSWRAMASGVGEGPVTLTLKQTGANVTGDLRTSGGAVNRSGPIAGVVSGNTLRVTSPPESNFALDVKGDEMGGQVYGFFPAVVNLKRQR
jgi:hypothetical protein